MKKNITLVCLNDFIRKETAKQLAKLRHMNYLDVDELLDFDVNKKQVSILCGDEYLMKLEKDCVERISEYTNCVFSISADMFLANDNRYYLENSNIIYLATEMHNIDLKKIKNKTERARLEQLMDVYENINEYLTKTCPLIIADSDQKEILDLAKEIDKSL